MTRRSRGRDSEDEPEPTYLRKPLDEVAAELKDRVAKGNTLQTSVSLSTILLGGQAEEFSARIRSWSDYNATYLERAFTTKELSEGYSNNGVPFAIVGFRETPGERLRQVKLDLQSDIDFLVGLQERLPLYVLPAHLEPLPPHAAVLSGARPPAAPPIRSPISTSATAPAPTAVDWATANRAFVQVIFDRFKADGEWPLLPNLQRELDRVEEDVSEPLNIDVEQTARTIPVEYGIKDYNPPRVSLKVRSLATLPAAEPLVEGFMRVVRLAVQRYLADDGPPKLRAQDLTAELGLDDAMARRVSILLDGEPLLLAGGVGVPTDANWERDVAQTIRYFRNAPTVETYLAAQARVMAVPTGTPPVIPRRRLFGSASINSTVLGAPAASAHQSVTLTLDDLHPAIREACASRFASEHYADGVQHAAIAFRDLVQTVSGLRTLDGPDLMSQAFSPKAPAIVVADLSTKTGQSIQLGTMMLAQGAMAAFRNVVAHERTDLDPAEALTMVGLFSLLAERVDAAAQAKGLTSKGST